MIDLVQQLESDKKVTWSLAHMQSALIHLSAQHSFSSLTTWLDGLHWDGRSRLWRYFTDAYGAEVSDYTAACARVLFLSAVARAYQPGCQADVRRG